MKRGRDITDELAVMRGRPDMIKDPELRKFVIKELQKRDPKRQFSVRELRGLGREGEK